MSKSLYKSTVEFLNLHSAHPIEGNHKRRIQTLAAMISSCMQSKSSSLEALSSPDKASDTQSESRIKQVKRWLSSKWTDWECFFAPYIKILLKKIALRGELILVIDGSETAGDCVTLMMSVIWRKYAIPLAWLTKKGEKGHFPEDWHVDLVTLAATIIPSGCRVVLLGDGEFDGQRLRAKCKEQKWEFVLRTSADRKVDCGGEIANLGDLYPLKGSDIVFVEDAVQGDNAILWCGKGYEKPIPLLTNMDLGEMACQYYKKRFKIELLFKQLKSAGFNIHKSKIQGEERVRNLIIVIALAFIFTFCIGLILLAQDKKVLNKLVRASRIQLISPLNITLKAFRKDLGLVINLFSNISKNWESLFFSQG